MPFPAECYRSAHISVCNLAQKASGVTLLIGPSPSWNLGTSVSLMTPLISFSSMSHPSWATHAFSLIPGLHLRVAVHTYPSCFGCVPRYSVYLLRFRVLNFMLIFSPSLYSNLFGKNFSRVFYPLRPWSSWRVSFPVKAHWLSLSDDWTVYQQGPWLFVVVVQLLSCAKSLWPHGLQHGLQASLSFTISQSLPKLMSIESAVLSKYLILVPFSCLQSFPASGSFPMSQFFASCGQNIEVSASASVHPMNTQGWSPSGWTGWTSLQSKGLSRVSSNTTVQKHQFFSAQPSSQSNSHIHTWPQEKP